MSDAPPPSYMDEVFVINEQRPRALTPLEIEREKERCAKDIIYFITKYCQIYDNVTASWIPFALWPSQAELIRFLATGKYFLLPKARQEGISWICGAARPLWKMLFLPIREVLIFSQRDDEAMKLLERLHGMYDRLPPWMQPGLETDSAHEVKFKNGSRVQALPSTAGGRSNAASDVVIDEADFVDGLKALISAAKPTIDAGDNQMVVFSTINEETPNSYFQRLCKGNAESDAGWKLKFLGWRANPNRTDEWYESQKTACLIDNGTLDPLYKEYPATLQEALAPRELNKRFPPDWIIALSMVRKPVPIHGDMPAVPGLKIYKVPEQGKRYGIGADPGGGKVDPSVAVVINAETHEQIAVLSGLIEPTEFANMVHELSVYYLGAAVLFELNNHGHAFLSQSKERGTTLKTADVTRRGQKARDPGWLTTERSKHMLYDVGAKVMQEIIALANVVGGIPSPILCDSQTIAELTSIEVSTLEAPEGMHDDHSMAWCLAQMCIYRGTASVQQTQISGLFEQRAAEEPEVLYAGPGRVARNIKVPGPISRQQPKRQPVRREAVESERVDRPVPKHIQERWGRY